MYLSTESAWYPVRDLQSVTTQFQRWSSRTNDCVLTTHMHILGYHALCMFYILSDLSLLLSVMIQGSLHCKKAVYRQHHFITSGGIQNHLLLSVSIQKITPVTEETTVHNHIQYNSNVVCVILVISKLPTSDGHRFYVVEQNTS